VLEALETFVAAVLPWSKEPKKSRTLPRVQIRLCMHTVFFGLIHLVPSKSSEETDSKPDTEGAQRFPKKFRALDTKPG
jgi:hypothetical protein